MPLYEYQCRSCSQQFEVLVRGSEQPACPSCGNVSPERRQSTFAAHANGSRREAAAPGPCGSCGDPRGPGACSIN